MADTTTLSLPNSVYAEAYQKIYDSVPKQTITPQEIKLDERTKESITTDINSYLRPYYDLAAKQRLATAEQSRAELDADAYSRGMGSSTWLTDKKSRESMAAQTDVANLNAQYGAALNEGVNTQLQNYTSNKLAVAQTNAANKLSADQYNAEVDRVAREWAYKVLLDQIDLGAFETYYDTGSSGGSSGGSPIPKPTGDLLTNEQFSARLKTALAGANQGSQVSTSKQTGTSSLTSNKLLKAVS